MNKKWFFLASPIILVCVLVIYGPTRTKIGYTNPIEVVTTPAVGSITASMIEDPLDLSSKTLTLAANSVSSTIIQSSSVGPSKTTTDVSVANGTTKGIKKTIFVNGATILSKLTSSTANLVDIAGNEVITDMYFVTMVPAGVAATSTIGADVNLDAIGDSDGFFTNIDLNATGQYRLTTNDEANQSAYSKGLIPNATGAITITASGDFTTSSWSGGLLIEYINYY